MAGNRRRHRLCIQGVAGDGREPVAGDRQALGIADKGRHLMPRSKRLFDEFSADRTRCTKDDDFHDTLT